MKPPSPQPETSDGSPASADATDAPTATARALADAQRRLARRPWPSAELRSALIRAGHTDDAVDTAIETAIGAGWLDDAAAARGHAESLIARGAADPAWIESRLAARSIDPDLAANVARQVVPDRQSAVDAAVASAIARLGPRDRVDVQSPEPRSGGPTAAAATRIARRLAGRGFDQDAILTAFDRAGVRWDDLMRASSATRGGRGGDVVAGEVSGEVSPSPADEADPPAPDF
ncbi:MAG: RecX family transcriptional regulator [Phycisphaerales bacterium]